MKYKIIVDKQSRLNPSTEKREYEIDIEELRAKGNVYDSLVITKEEDYVMRRLSLSEFHVLSVLDEPVKEPIKGINIELFEGDNYIYLVDMSGNKFYAEYLIKNEFNDLYVIHSEMNSAINQSAKEIEIGVNQKLTNYSTTEEMNAAIKVLSDAIALEVAKKVNNEDLTSANIILRINEDDSSEAQISADKVKLLANDILTILANNVINLTSKNIVIASDYLNIDEKGNMILYAPGLNVFKVVNPNNTSRNVYINDQYIGIGSDGGDNLANLGIINNNEGILDLTGNGNTVVRASGIKTPTLTQTSTEESKKNFEKLDSDTALRIILATDIYKYNLKNQADGDKKHIGFVIGDKYKYSEEITSENNDGVDNYSMASAAYGAIQKLYSIIQELQTEIKQLKGEK